MAKKIYVGNMSYDTTESTLRELFAAHGEVVSVSVVTDRDTGRPRGFAFVEMATDAAANAAIAALDGQSVDGRTLKVNEARPPAPRSGGDRPYGGGGGRGGFGGRGGDRGGDRSRGSSDRGRRDRNDRGGW
ncbi:MAG TPA: RNA-binding protein [Anaerolineae bacterium]|nr:RNA-binding protein [Anaerolineae bacterium]HQI83763.1 RNA-binding protein [Anaerolineae bacterium]